MYGILCTLGIAASSIVGCILAKKRKIDSFDFVLSAIFTLIGAWLGAKILFLIVSWKDVVALFNNYSIGTSIKALFTGGYVFYGGFIGGAITLFLTLKILKKNIVTYFGIYAIILPLGHAFGRLGCFVSGCCYGIKYNGALSYTYNQALDSSTPLGIPLLPIQLIESFILFILFCILLFLFFKFQNLSIAIFTYCISYSIIRFVLEFFRGDTERGLSHGISTSQWISLIIFIVATIHIAIIRIIKKKTNNSQLN